ncbi:nuclear transport factor 2 family protein [Nocardioides sp. BP30]|uniref:YybH family protein n=1 Tax=Nocardioides sp. BP30 TaxID=3036374 RepID=UPI00246837CA|nr:nuclear transport factor 2 family protein [Nocardioides sp. BP30]WGL52300.1 nuclear transport factor 2 family protein [Nocardioides sp. BP30]
MPELTIDEVLEATDRLVKAFADTDTDAYFACFADSATFVFHPEARRLDDRAAYESLWAGWIADGWRVEECESTERLVQVHGETGILSHSVRTVTSVGGERTTTYERESIVFVRDGDDLVAVHEHLSPAPADD